VTVVFPSPEISRTIANKFNGKHRGKFDIRIQNSFRPDQHSPSRPPGELSLRHPQDDSPTSISPFAKGSLVQDWKMLTVIPEVPPGLTVLSLRYNALSEFSVHIETLTHLDLTGNDLTQIVSLKNTQLTTLSLSHNFLEHLPELPLSITTIEASYCRLVDLDDSIQAASRLRTLDISFNKITRIPALPQKIRVLRADHNAVAVIDDGSPLTFLEEITLDHNKLQTIPASLNRQIASASLLWNSLPAVSLAWFRDSVSSINLSGNALEAIPPELF
jgi:Leucine-rich repeat (LRR) protein